MFNFHEADLHVEEIYDLIKSYKVGIALATLAAKYPSRDITVPYVVGKLLADGKVRTEQRGDTLFCVAVETSNATEFEKYLQQYGIDPVYLSRMARVRYLRIWHAQKGYPITREHARKIEEAVLKRTGVAYSGPFVEAELPTEKEILTFPVKKLHKH